MALIDAICCTNKVQDVCVEIYNSATRGIKCDPSVDTFL